MTILYLLHIIEISTTYRYRFVGMFFRRATRQRRRRFENTSRLRAVDNLSRYFDNRHAEQNTNLPTALFPRE